VSPDEIAERLANQIGTIDSLKGSLPYEPMSASKVPLVTQMFQGFVRAGLETPDLGGTPIKDPLGGRSWVYQYATRLWVGLGSNAEAAQREAQKLTYQVVLALEQDKTLGGIADDTAMATGDLDVVAPKSGQPLIRVTFATQVEITEAR